MNNRIEIEVELLDSSFYPIPTELNELDWRSGLSDKTDRLAQHISAFANYPGGGFLVYGISTAGQTAPLFREDMDSIVRKLGNIARDNLAQPIGIEPAINNYKGSPVLIIYVQEHTDKPVYLRSHDIFDS